MTLYRKKSPPFARVLEIVRRLTAFEKVHVASLALEFGVDERTVRRDLHKIAQTFPLASKCGMYALDLDAYTAKQSLPRHLLRAFATNAGLRIAWLKEDAVPLVTFAVAYDGLDATVGQAVLQSIEAQTQCRFVYTNNQGEYAVRVVSPAMLYTEKGRWYLVGKDEHKGKMRVFSFAKIKNFTVLEAPSSLSEADIRQESRRMSVWQTEGVEPFEVKVLIDKSVKHYFDEVPLHKSQELLELHHDTGDAVYGYRITHPMELLPEIKSWLPHVRILSPASLKQQLLDDLHAYLKSDI